MSLAERYRWHAAECIRVAEHIHDPTEKSSMFRMAEAWMRLAERAEVLAAEAPSADTSGEKSASEESGGPENEAPRNDPPSGEAPPDQTAEISARPDGKAE